MNKPLLYTLAIAAIAFTQSRLSIGSLQWALPPDVGEIDFVEIKKLIFKQ